MTIFNIFIDREKKIQTYIEGESIALYEKADELNNKYNKTFAIQIISSGIGDAYDFFCYIHGTNNLFYKNIKQLDEVMANKIFCWLSLYHIVCHKERNRIKFNQIKQSMAYVFGWDERHKALYKHFRNIKRKSNAVFQWQFAKIMIDDIFQDETINPVILAHLGNLIYNSNIRFEEEMTKLRNEDEMDQII